VAPKKVLRDFFLCHLSVGRGRETGVSRGGRTGKTVGFPGDKVAPKKYS